MGHPLVDRAILLYLGALAAVSTGSIGLMYLLFTSGFPTFIDAFTDSPGATAQDDPLSLLTLFAIFVLLFLLVALVVLFGANYALDAEEPDTE